MLDSNTQICDCKKVTLETIVNAIKKYDIKFSYESFEQ